MLVLVLMMLLLLAFAALSGRNPRALHVSRAVKASTLTASSTPHVDAVFLGSIAAVLAIEAVVVVVGRTRSTLWIHYLNNPSRSVVIMIVIA